MATKKEMKEEVMEEMNEQTITTEEALFGDALAMEGTEEEAKAMVFTDTPMRVTDQKTHKVYSLDYSRETVIMGERAGLVWDELGSKPAFTITLAWYLAFRKNHPQVTEQEASRMLKDLGGVTAPIIGKLRHLYDNAIVGLMNLDGEQEKNAKVTVEL